MPNLIPTGERGIYISAIDDVHDTMARDITVWKPSSEEILVENTNYDAFYDKQVNNVIYTPISYTIKARIKYLDKQDKDYGLAIAFPQNQTQVTQEFLVVRVKVHVDDLDKIQGAEKVSVDGIDFRIVTSRRPHGVFDINYYTFYLRSFV